MEALGYVEGKNVTYVGRWSDAQFERLPGVGAELVALDVDVMLTTGAPAAAAAKGATSAIPVVVVVPGDAVATGLVTSLGRPGGNVTGISDPAAELSAKRLEVLKEALPSATRVAVHVECRRSGDDPALRRDRESGAQSSTSASAARRARTRGHNDALAAMTRDRPDALFLVTDALTVLNRQRIIEFASAQHIPAMYEFGLLVRDGGLMSYGPEMDEMYRRAATYVDQIFLGAKPSELPVELPTRYYLVVNLKTAKELGLTLPQALLLRADEVIE